MWFCKRWAAKLGAQEKKSASAVGSRSGIRGQLGELRRGHDRGENRLGYIQNRDYRVMRRVNRWKAPRWIRYWMIAATRIGDGWLWYRPCHHSSARWRPEPLRRVSAAACAALAGVFVFNS